METGSRRSIVERLIVFVVMWLLYGFTWILVATLVDAIFGHGMRGLLLTAVLFGFGMAASIPLQRRLDAWLQLRSRR